MSGASSKTYYDMLIMNYELEKLLVKTAKFECAKSIMK